MEQEQNFKKKFNDARKIFLSLSSILRSINSLQVAIPAFCDILRMYG